jgi:uncharacterized phiE125 gp8 family phage protein
MGLSLFAAPAVEPVDVSEMAQFSRLTDISGGSEEYLLTTLLQAARQHLDGADGWLGRALITQTWDYTLDCFPWGREPILLPLSPAQSVTSISYIATDGTPTTWTNTLYSVDIISEPARVMPIYTEIYPVARTIPNAVTVRFKAGYGLRPEDVPAPIRFAIMSLAAHWYENREAVLVGVTDAMPLPMHIDALLASYRVRCMAA